MQYRKFGKLDWQVSALGFGAMRLPTLDASPFSGAINEPEAINMIRTAIDHGVNYLDTAYPYHHGNSELIVEKALQDGYRTKVKLATKSPVWLIEQTADFDKFLNEQLQKLQTEQIDFYLLHALNGENWQTIVLKFNLLEKIEAALQDGRIGHIGFSFHDDYEAFTKIIDGYASWTFCQIQYNYMDITNQAGTKGLKYAAERGLAVVVMEPLLGGKLAAPPPAIQKVFDEFPIRRSAADWGLQWLWDQPEVSMVLSGMSTMEQVSENLASAKRSQANSLDEKAQQLIKQIRQKLHERFPISCTKCGYCLPCPQGVAIPDNLSLYNTQIAYEDQTGTRNIYRHFMPENERANHCIQCRSCEATCPQKIAISDWLTKVHAALGD